MFVQPVSVLQGGVHNERTENHGTIKGGEFRAIVLNSGSIEGGVFYDGVYNYQNAIISGGAYNGLVESKGTIDGGEFSKEIINSGTIKKAVLKAGASIKNENGKIEKLIINDNLKLDDNILNITSSIEMKPGSTLELSSMPDLRKFINPQNIKVDDIATISGKTLIIQSNLKTSKYIIDAFDSIEMRPGTTLDLDATPDIRKFTKIENIKINGQDLAKGDVFRNHAVIDGGNFDKPVINEKDGIINGGQFENLENHGTINGGELSFDNNSVEVFKNDGIINDGRFIAKNTYNSGVIKYASFTGTVHNEGGSITGGKFDYLELISGNIQNIKIDKGLIIKGGSVGHITLRGGYEKLSRNALPEIKNEAGITIEKLSITGKVKLDANVLNNIINVELLPQKAYGGTILYLDALPDFSKIKGFGSIKVGNVSYKVDGSIISGQNQNMAFVNNSFKLDSAVEKIKEQKANYLDDQNAQNNPQVDLQAGLQVGLLATPQNSDNNLL